MFPNLSVTVIGLVVGIGGALTRRGTWRSGVAGLVGAWVGFAIGALIGGVLDVALGTGVWVAIAGHALAVAGALGSVLLLDRFPLTGRD
jgi:hypothetical protein